MWRSFVFLLWARPLGGCPLGAAAVLALRSDVIPASRPSYCRLVAQGRQRCRPARDASNADVADAARSISPSFINTAFMPFVFVFFLQFHAGFTFVSYTGYYPVLRQLARHLMSAQKQRNKIPPLYVHFTGYHPALRSFRLHSMQTSSFFFS